MANMRAKVRVSEVKAGNGQEQLTFHPVAKSGGYPEDGSDEDNSYAKWSPSGEFRLTVANPALHGQFKVGQTYYVDFTEVTP